MSEEAEMIVEAQCQRCGRGFLRPYEGTGYDEYGHPRNHQTVCGGPVWFLVEPVPMRCFKNYGKLLPSFSPEVKP